MVVARRLASALGRSGSVARMPIRSLENTALAPCVLGSRLQAVRKLPKHASRSFVIERGRRKRSSRCNELVSVELALQRSKMRTTTAAARLTAVDGVEVDVAELWKHEVQKVWHGRMELGTYFRDWAAREVLTSSGWLE